MSLDPRQSRPWYAPLRKFERRLEKQPSLNLLLIVVELAVWAFISWLALLPLTQAQQASHIPRVIAIVLAATAVYHFIICYLLNRHISRYEYPRAMKETWPLRRFWASWLGLHIASFIIFNFGWFSILGLLLVWLTPRVIRERLSRELPVEYESGTKLVSKWRVQDEFLTELEANDQGAFFGGVLIPTSEMVTHAKLLGSSRSGKTMLIRLYMQSVLPIKPNKDVMPTEVEAVESIPKKLPAAPETASSRLKRSVARVAESKPPEPRNVSVKSCKTPPRGTRNRALIYDPKTEFIPTLVGMGIAEEDIIVLNPFDARGRCWDMAKDLTDDLDAEALAQILVPERKDAGTGKYFEDATRIMLAAVTKLFMQYAPKRWTLRDLILATESLELITLLLERDPDLAADLRSVGASDTADNVMGTMATVTRRGLKTVAAYMDYHFQEGRSFTLQHWLENKHILLLGTTRKAESTIRPLNQLLITRIFQLATSELYEGYTYIILDELPELGKIGDIDRVARLAASYRVSLMIAFQAYTDLERIYGKDSANSLIGQCDKSAYLRVKDGESAEWAAKQIGQVTKRKKSKSYKPMTDPREKRAIARKIVGLHEERIEEFAVKPPFFLNLKRPKPPSGDGEGAGLSGVFNIGHLSYKHTISTEELSRQLAPDDEGAAKKIDAPRTAQKLRRWTREDVTERLGFARLFLGSPPDLLRGTELESLMHSPGDIPFDFETPEVPELEGEDAEEEVSHTTDVVVRKAPEETVTEDGAREDIRPKRKSRLKKNLKRH